MSNSHSIRPWIEGALLASLAAVLSTIVVFRMPLGGSVTPGASVAICVAGLRNGPRIGCFAGLGYGILNFLLSGATVLGAGPFVFDYLLAGTLLGIAGFWSSRPLLGILMGQLGRGACHIASGFFFFSAEGYSLKALQISAAYNLSYLIPDIVIGILLFRGFWKKERRYKKNP